MLRLFIANLLTERRFTHVKEDLAFAHNFLILGLCLLTLVSKGLVISDKGGSFRMSLFDLINEVFSSNSFISLALDPCKSLVGFN